MQRVYEDLHLRERRICDEVGEGRAHQRGVFEGGREEENKGVERKEL